MKIKVIAAVAVLAVGLSGCGRVDRWTAGMTGKGSEVCHRGVTYVQFTSGASVAVDREGKPIPCGPDVAK